MTNISWIHLTWINSQIEGGASLEMPHEERITLNMTNDHKVAHGGARRLCYPSLAWPHGTITMCGGK